MKIIIKTDEPIRVYHHPRDVSVHPKSKEVHAFNTDGTLLESFQLLDKETTWSEDMDSDQSELIVILNVKK